jgi:hypothetical protein
VKIIRRLKQRIFLVFAILFTIAFQSVFFPLAVLADTVQPWNGNPWDGNPWEGQPWDGNDLKWEGGPWNSESWNGDPWSGDPWNGDPWNGNDWQGNPWERDSWNGDPWDGDTWNGNPWGGDPWNSSSWDGTPWDGNGWNGNPWSLEGFDGVDSWEGRPWYMEGWTMDGFNGVDPWNGPQFHGEGFEGSATQGDTTDIPIIQTPEGFEGKRFNLEPFSKLGPSDYQVPERFYDGDNFKATEFLVNDMFGGTANLINDTFENGIPDPSKYGVHIADLLVNSTKLQLGDNGSFEAYDTARKLWDIYEGYDELETLRDAKFGYDAINQGTNVAQQVSNASKYSQYLELMKDSGKTVLNSTSFDNISGTFSKMGALSKFNFVTSGINAGISAYKTGSSLADAINISKSGASGSEVTAAYADVGSNLGETLMSLGGVAAAIPGGQAVGAGLAIAGAGIFVVSKTTKFVAKNWDTISGGISKGINTLKNARDKVVKGAVKGVVKAGKKIGEFIGGFFS